MHEIPAVPGTWYHLPAIAAHEQRGNGQGRTTTSDNRRICSVIEPVSVREAQPRDPVGWVCSGSVRPCPAVLRSFAVEQQDERTTARTRPDTAGRTDLLAGPRQASGRYPGRPALSVSTAVAERRHTRA